MIRIVSDTAASLPPNLIDGQHITIVSGYLQFGDEDMIQVYPDLPTEDFYRRLSASPTIPTFYEPSIAAFQMAYQHLLNADPQAEILSIHLSEKLSATFANASTAATAYADRDIRLFDTESVSVGQGLVVYEAARMAAEGRSMGEILVNLKTMREHLRVYFALDTLDYLAHSGRVSGLQRFVGQALDMKPILTMRGGELQPLDQPVRSRERALARLRELALNDLAGHRDVRLAVAHAVCGAEAQALADELAAELLTQSVLFCELGPSLGAHTGPGAVGIAWYAPWEGRAA